MSSVYIVGGEEHSKLRAYIEARGSLDVVGSVDYLWKSKSEIVSSIIKADKMIYLYLNDSINIREEMNVLRSLLEGDGFFSVKEIIFFILETPVSERGVAYIKSLEAQLKQEELRALPSFDLKISNVVISYEDIYSELLGLQDFGGAYSNKKVTVYRVERGSKVKRISEDEDSSEMAVVPYDLSNIKIYSDMKKSTAIAEYFNPIVESLEEKVKYDNPRIGSYNLDPNVTATNLVILTGDRYSGKTTTLCALGSSIASAGNKVLMVDLTGKSDIRKCLSANGQGYYNVELGDYIGSALFEEASSLYVLAPVRAELAINVLTYLLDNHKRTGYDAILVEVDPSDITEDIVSGISRFIKRVIYTCNRLEDSVSQIQGLERILPVPSICLVGSTISLTGYRKVLDNSDIKERLRSVTAVASLPLNVESNPYLYDILLKGRM